MQVKLSFKIWILSIFLLFGNYALLAQGTESPLMRKVKADHNNVVISWFAPGEEPTLTSESFEGEDFPPEGWSVKASISLDGALAAPVDESWKLYTGSTTSLTHSGQNSAKISWKAKKYNYLITPNFDVEANTKLNFYIHLKTTANNYSHFYVRVFADDAWTTIAEFGAAPITINMYEKQEVDLSAYAGKKIKVAFVYNSDNGWALYLDDVSVSNSKSLMRDPLSGFKVYRDSVEIASLGATDRNYADNNVPLGEHTYAVTALYGTDESEYSEAITVESKLPFIKLKTDKNKIGLNENILYEIEESKGTIVSYEWNFDDGATPATANTEGPHTVQYSTLGKKNVSLILNGYDTTIVEQLVTVVTGSAANNQVTNFTASAVFNDAKLSWKKPTPPATGFKVFRDGVVIATLGAADSTYKDALLAVGSYEYAVSAVYASGESYPTDPIKVTIKGVKAIIEADNTPVGINQNVVFTVTTMGTINTYEWNFGDGATPATANTEGPHTVTYSSLGQKTVSLTVNGDTTITKENIVRVIPGTAANKGPEHLYANAFYDTVTLSWTPMFIDTVFRESFEGATFPPANWAIQKSTTDDINSALIDTTNTWERAMQGFSFQAHDGEYAAKCTYSNKGHNWLVMPEMSLAPNSSLNFWIKYLNTGNYHTDFRVMVFSEGVWHQELYWTEGSPSYNMNSVITVDLSTYANKTVKIAFVQSIVRYFFS